MFYSFFWQISDAALFDRGISTLLNGIFGTLIGSFLNVVIHRVPLEKSVVFPASHCPQCQSGIRFYDNIPILSWLLLRGKCRTCRHPISPRYPLIELLTGLVFAAIFWHDGFSPLLPFDLLLSAALIALIFIDAEHQILPNAITYPGIVLALTARAAIPLIFQTASFDDLTVAPLNSTAAPLWVISLGGALVGALVGGGFLWLVGFLWKLLRGVEGMGMGDVKLMLMLGAYLGWRLTLLTIFLGAFSGAVGGMILVSQQNDKDYQTRIPFGVFLGIGALISILFGSQIINWYLTNFVPN